MEGASFKNFIVKRLFFFAFDKSFDPEFFGFALTTEVNLYSFFEVANISGIIFYGDDPGGIREDWRFIPVWDGAAASSADVIYGYRSVV